MTWRKLLTTILVVMMTSPAWGATKPLGNITSRNNANIRDTKLTAGSTVFSGDAISVSEHGGARVAFSSGGQAEILSNSLVRLTTSDGNIQMAVDRGQASFHTSGGNKISALVADATVRPESGAETSAIIQSLTKTHAVIAAEKGVLVITTAHDGKIYTLTEGQAADLSVAPDNQQGGGTVPSGQTIGLKPLSRKGIIWTVAIVGAGAAVAGYLLNRKETKLSPPGQISPNAPI
jgi:hypothetical protein